MSDNQPEQLSTNTNNSPLLETVLLMRARDLVKGFKVGRVLPAAKRRMVGPFIFFDQMGPEVLSPGNGLDVAPHPHIGLATVTYLFQGELSHRDSLGTIQSIYPGEVNWMVAGRGIAHSERTPLALRQTGSPLFGIQSWVALPAKYEEIEPTFSHYGVEQLPLITAEGKQLRLIAGSLFGERSPVATHSELFYADVILQFGARLPIDNDYEERAAYIVEGTIEITDDGSSFHQSQLLIFKPGVALTLRAVSASVRLMLLGGASMDSKRYIWWNFVSSSPARIDQAKADWKAGNFIAVPGETESIPLPETGPAVVRYP